MTDQAPPKIEFPCANYPIKVMGDASEEFRAFVISVMAENSESFDSSTMTIRPSKNGRYEAITSFVIATGTDQLNKIFADLKKHPSLRMVL